MKTTKKIISLFLSAIMVMATFVSITAFADTTFTNPSLYFSEDFEDDTVDSTVAEVPNKFLPRSSKVAQDANSGNKYLINNQSDFRFGSTGNHFSTWLAARGCSHWIFSFDMCLPTLPPDDKPVSLTPRYGGSNKNAISFKGSNVYYNNGLISGITTKAGEWMHITYMCNGNGVDIYVNDTVVYDTDANSVANMMYLNGSNHNFYVDNFKVYGFSKPDIVTAVANADICRVKSAGLPSARLDAAVAELINAENIAVENGTHESEDYTSEIDEVNDMITLYNTAVSENVLAYALFKDDATFGTEVQNLLAYFNADSTGTASELSSAVDAFEAIFKRTVNITEFSVCDNAANIKGGVIPAKATALNITVTPDTAGTINASVTSGADGKFSYDFELNTPESTGNYTVTVTSTEADGIPFDVASLNTKTFELKNAADRTSALAFSSYSNANLSAFETELKTTNNFFYCLDMATDSDYDKLIDKNYVLEKLLENKPYTTVADLKSEFVYHITMQRLRETTEPAEIAGMLENYYNALTGDTLSEKYTTYKMQICELLPANISAVTDAVTLKKFIKTAEMYYVINSATRMTIADTFDTFVNDTDYYNILKDCGLDEDYKTVDSSIQVSAATSILDAGLSLTNNFNLATEMSKLVGAVNTVVNTPVEEPDPEPTYTPSYSGGGFGSVSISKKEDTEKEETPVVPQPVVTPDPVNTDYTDVCRKHWAADSIYAVRDKGIMTGDGSGNFYPDNYLKREEMAKIIVEAFDITAENARSSFADISDDMWCSEYIATAVKAGLINGISENEFGFGNVMTRQDIAVIVYRYLSQKEINFEEIEVEEFSDETEIADYAKDAVKFMQKYNLMVGSDGKFNPRQPLTRAMAAKIICNITSK